MSKILRSAAVGLIASMVFAGVSFAVAQSSGVMLGAYTAPIRILPPFNQLQGEVAISILFGTPTPPGLMLLFVLSVLFWTVVFGGLYFLLSRQRHPIS